MKWSELLHWARLKNVELPKEMYEAILGKVEIEKRAEEIKNA